MKGVMMKKLILVVLSAVLLAATALAQDNLEEAVFAGGCFWCVESDFEKHEGVVQAISGYMGGTVENPTYTQVSSGRSGHLEVVKVVYDPAVISYQELLDIFWRLHDPSDATGSFVDRGEQYTSAIFYMNEDQQRLAEGAKLALERSGKFDQIATTIRPAETFYVAEDYHQDYYLKSAGPYRYYRFASGRDQFIERFWKGDEVVYQLEENLTSNDY
jgi:peptide methionine sulfoxide reductase msrA/msrB